MIRTAFGLGYIQDPELDSVQIDYMEIGVRCQHHPDQGTGGGSKGAVPQPTSSSQIQRRRGKIHSNSAGGIAVQQNNRGKEARDEQNDPVAETQGNGDGLAIVKLRHAA